MFTSALLSFPTLSLGRVPLWPQELLGFPPYLAGVWSLLSTLPCTKSLPPA